MSTNEDLVNKFKHFYGIDDLAAFDETQFQNLRSCIALGSKEIINDYSSESRLTSENAKLCDEDIFSDIGTELEKNLSEKFIKLNNRDGKDINYKTNKINSSIQVQREHKESFSKFEKINLKLNEAKSLFNEFDNSSSNHFKLRKERSSRWTKEEDELLIALVEEFEGKGWKKIATFIKERTPIQCLHRWSKILKPGLVKGPWTFQEDKMLINWVNINGSSDFSNCNNVIVGRNSKQCRERWLNVLNPEVIKGDWLIHEDYLIFKLYLTFGGKWIKFVPFFKGLRAENSIKNRFYSTIRRFNTMLKKQKVNLSELEKVKSIYSDVKVKLINKHNIRTEEELKKFEYEVLGWQDKLDEKNKFNLFNFDKSYPSIIEQKNLKSEFRGNKKQDITFKQVLGNKLNTEISECDHSISESLRSNIFSSNLNTELNEAMPKVHLEKKIQLLGQKTKSSYSNMSLDELETKILDFCNNKNVNMFDDWNKKFSNKLQNANEKFENPDLPELSNNDVSTQLNSNGLFENEQKLLSSAILFKTKQIPKTHSTDEFPNSKITNLMSQLDELEYLVKIAKDQLSSNLLEKKIS